MGKKIAKPSTTAEDAEIPAPTPASTASPIPPPDRPGVIETTLASNGTTEPTSPTLGKKPAPKPVKARKRPSKKAAIAEPVALSTEDIALRAYFIHEDRHRHGIHGDEHSDWVEAERQLLAELKKKKRTGKKPAGSRKKKA
jgi:hypothetical protein